MEVTTAAGRRTDPSLHSGRRRWYLHLPRQHPAATVLLGALLAAGPVLVFSMASSRWFYLDEWDFLADRRAFDLGDLLRPHNENLSTLPILVYRAIFHVVHLSAYWPYVIPVVIAHLCVVGLLWMVMRRSGVNQWVALAGALLLLFLGSGYQDIVWGFQIGFTGALAFGLGQLLLADRAGPLDRRDAAALLAGLAAVCCSAIAITTVLMVGVAAVCRREWKRAAVQTLPLGLLYVIWARFAHPSPPSSFGTSLGTRADAVLRWDEASYRYAALGLGHHPVAAGLLGLLLVGGLILAWATSPRPVLGHQRLIVACLVGSLSFVSIAGLGRWEFGSHYSSTSRYVYLTVALLLPPLAVAADAVIKRWRWTIPVCAAVALVGLPANVGAFNHQMPRPGVERSDAAFLATLARSPLLGRVPPNTPVVPLYYPGLNAGWIAQAGHSGWLPAAPTRPDVAIDAPLLLGLDQSMSGMPADVSCQQGASTFVLHPGQTFWLPGHGFLAAPIRIGLVDAKAHPLAGPMAYSRNYGERFTATVVPLHLRVSSPPGSFTQITVCRAKAHP